MIRYWYLVRLGSTLWAPGLIGTTMDLPRPDQRRVTSPRQDRIFCDRTLSAARTTPTVLGRRGFVFVLLGSVLTGKTRQDKTLFTLGPLLNAVGEKYTKYICKRNVGMSDLSSLINADLWQESNVIIVNRTFIFSCYHLRTRQV